jgi:hypothetical protein
MSQKKETCG